MRILKMILIIVSFLSLNKLYAENHMELIWEVQGEHIEAEYGYSIASIDFNGDGIDDLVVGSYRWNYDSIPGGTPQGKIYFYYGGNSFDNIPELTMDGDQYSYSTGLGKKIVNLGDVNGDGYEDLGSKRYGDWQSDVKCYLEIFFGGPDCDTIPDFQHIIYRDDIDDDLYSFYPLGDVNGDGYDDAGYVIITAETEVNQYYIIFGGETLEVEYWNTVGSGGMSIRGIGNINNDEYDDFLICFKDTENQLKHNVVIYGNTIIDTVLTDTLYSQTGITFDSGGAYAGDFDGDGTDDFIGCFGFYEVGTFLWFGTEAQNSEPSVILDAITGGPKSISFGDLNNDGFSDLVLCSPNWSNHQGKAYFFIGDENANGSIDFDIEAPVIVGTYFGTAVAMGDFNNDGFDDTAIGAPDDYGNWYPGYVYVYAGNDSLEETTPVSIIEEEIPVADGIEFHAYPNPFNPTVNFEIKAEGYDNLQIEIYNIKGQMVKTVTNESFDKGNHSVVWNGVDDSGRKVSSGVYFYKLNVNGKSKAIKKCLLLK